MAGSDKQPQVGERFGRLIVVDVVGKVAVCVCDCGRRYATYGYHLEKGNVRSCGCFRNDLVTERIKSLTEDQRKQAYETYEARYRIDGAKTPTLRSKRRSDNKTGVKGVYRQKNSYIASIQLRGKPHYLGSFRTLEDAAAARKKAETELFDPILQKEIQGKT